MNIKLADGDYFPRGLCRVSLLAPCAVCGKKFMDNFPARYPVWSDKETTLVCRDCWLPNKVESLSVIQILERELSDDAEGLSTSELEQILAEIKRYDAEMTEALHLLEEFTHKDKNPCHTDVSGYCNEHDWKRRDGCPVGRAQTLLYGGI